jgi:hypothetical protein
MQDDEADSDVYGETASYRAFSTNLQRDSAAEPPPPAADIAKAALEGAGAIAAAALLKIQCSSAHRKAVAAGLRLSAGNMPAVLKKLSGRVSELEVLDA